MKYRVKSIKFAFAVNVNKKTTFSIYTENPTFANVEVVWDSDTSCYFIKSNDEIMTVSQHGNCVFALLDEPMSDSTFKTWLLGEEFKSPKRRGKKGESLSDRMNRLDA